MTEYCAVIGQTKQNSGIIIGVTIEVIMLDKLRELVIHHNAHQISSLSFDQIL